MASLMILSSEAVGSISDHQETYVPFVTEAPTDQMRAVSLLKLCPCRGEFSFRFDRKRDAGPGAIFTL